MLESPFGEYIFPNIQCTCYMLLNLNFAQEENLEIQAIFERQEINILLEEGEKDDIAAISLFQFVN